MEFKADALVLRAADWGEYDKIVTLFTAERGKLSAALKGVKRAGAKLRFAAQPFCFAEFVFAEKSGRNTVISASVHDGFYALREDIACYYAAVCVAEACDKLLFEGMVSPSLFLAAVRALGAQGYRLPPVAWIEYVAILALAGLIFWLGWTVRAYQKGAKPNLDPLRAARTFVLAKAGALTGALLTGRYLASLLDVVGDLGIPSQRDRAVAAGIAAACSVVLTVVGLVVEKFCELPPPEDDAEKDGNRGPEALAG